MSWAEQEKAISRVHRAIETVKAGGMVIMVDDEDRENEGDLVFAAECVTPRLVNFMAKEARGLICLTLAPEIVDRLHLRMMEDSAKKVPTQNTAFTVSIEARTGVTTGISAADRARTIQVAIDDATLPEDIVVPGHIFPLKSRPGGVLERAGHTEGSVDLARLAGYKGAGVICEIMNDDGTMARMPDLEAFAAKHDIPIVAIADIITYRLLQESLVKEVVRRPIKTSYGVFESILFRSAVDGTEHLAIVKGSDFADQVVDVRVHSQRPLIDVFGDRKRGGRFRIEYGLKMLAESDHAVLIYLTHANANERFLADLDELAHDAAENPPHESLMPPANMDLRLVGTGAQIIRSLGINRMRIHTTSQRPIKGLGGFGLEAVDTAIIRPADQ